MFKWLFKENPAQEQILLDQGESHYSDADYATVENAYLKNEIVSRGINMIVDSAAEIPVDVLDAKIGSPTGAQGGRMRAKKLITLLNFYPNPYLTAEEFRRNVFLDLIVDGNAFIYYDGVHLYNLPAKGVEVVADKIRFISHYEYGDQKFSPEEILHIRDNTVGNIFRGTSRLNSALDSIGVAAKMTAFQDKFFKNNAVPGLVIETDEVMSDKIKERKVQEWASRYNPASGGKRPMILDGGLKLKNLGNTDFRELDFKDSITTIENRILKALGVPPILLDSGNNANISPNLKLFYYQTIIPLTTKYVSSLERFFGYDIKPLYDDIMALQPELEAQADFYTQMTNAGILTRNEARVELRYEKHTDPTADDLILPANVAGSAQDSSTGGRPKEDNANAKTI